MLTPAEQKQALENSLVTFKFARKYFIYTANKGRNTVFAIAEQDKGVTVRTKFMEYDEMNSFFTGYQYARTKAFEHEN